MRKTLGTQDVFNDSGRTGNQDVLDDSGINRNQDVLDDSGRTGAHADIGVGALHTNTLSHARTVETIGRSRKLKSSRIRTLAESVLNILDCEEYPDYVGKLTLLEKRKLLGLLMLLVTHMTIKDLVEIRIDEFKHVFIEGKVLSKNGRYISIKEETRHLFIPELYETLIHGKREDLTVLSSIITSKPLSQINAQRDIYEEIVKTLSLHNKKEI